jgi:ADP-ribose pyrophosphatase
METLMTSHRLYEGRVLNLRVDDVRLPDGQAAVREVVEHDGAVAVVALDDDDGVLLIKQYRHAIGQVLIELPAGVLEPGEDPRTCAARELEEETGCRAAVFEPLITIYPSPGYTTEIIHLFIARHLEMGPPRPEPDEYIELMRVPLAEALNMVERGEVGIHNSITLVGLLTTARKLGV